MIASIQSSTQPISPTNLDTSVCKKHLNPTTLLSENIIFSIGIFTNFPKHLKKIYINWF